LAFYNREYDHSTFSYYLGGDPKAAFKIFAAGYRSAAEQLTESLLGRSHFPGFEAYPVIFLYCHALELSLKHAIYKAVEFAGYTGSSEIEDRLCNVHELDRLAGTLSRSVELLFPGDTFIRNLLERINATSHELNEIDITSFRYPIDRNGMPTLEPNKSVNLRDFAADMSSLLEDIDTLNFGLDTQTYIAQEVFTECVLGGLA